jgi:hypothetical protein
MIRIRKLDGSLVVLDQSVAAVELCSTDGLLAAVLVPDGLSIHVYEHGDEEFELYRRGTGMRAANRVNMDGD